MLHAAQVRASTFCVVAILSLASPWSTASDREWLAGDHHIHSEFSVGYVSDPADPAAPPRAVPGGDGRYSIQRNAEEARRHGLHWMVSTDHGGPGHSRISHDHIHPAVEAARREVPQVLHFFGMEFDTPAGEHSSLIIPQGPGERRQLQELEAGFARKDVHPLQRSRDTEAFMLTALDAMRAQPRPPLLIANHPSRTVKTEEGIGRYAPHEFRAWNDRAPEVAIGMEGAPGHQAASVRRSGAVRQTGQRGGYDRVPTRGGFDPMTALLGGVWDSLLAEGRHWWVTATSDSHQHWREGGADFWPGEYSKTWVLARPEADDIFEGLRAGRVFVSTGDLVTGVELQASVGGGPAQSLSLGTTLGVPQGATVTLTLRVRDPQMPNHHGDRPEVQRLDAIVGRVTGRATDADQMRHAGVSVAQRFDATQWQRDGEWIRVQLALGPVDTPQYLRWRGTSTSELEPSPDPAGEDPWTDLWFYTNPVFIVPAAAAAHSPG